MAAAIATAVIGQQPPVTRCLVVASIALTALCSLEVVSPNDLLFINWPSTIYGLELWRPFTSFLYFGSFGMPFVFQIHVMVSICSRLEASSFYGRPADFVWMLVCCAGMSLLLTDLLGLSHRFWNTSALLRIVIYLLARRSPSARYRLLIFPFVTIRGPYLPMVLVCFSVLRGRPHMLHIFMDMLVGHFYYFFEDVYPSLPTAKGFRLFRTPAVLKAACGQKD